VQELVPGTQVLKELNVWLERDGYRTVSGYLLAKAAKPSLLHPDVLDILLGIDELAR